ncbi:MAG TPA: aminotransferase class V-fold PLP-dependent enzyme [Anaerolineales bacterium]|nr:aminotransferase class V-fold PLP-dependent enzyme [Anaerolineales bacterium]
MPSLKKHFLLDPKIYFLNHGSFGATPKPVFREYQRWQKELEGQPVEFLGRRHNGLMRASRAVLADYLGTTAENVVYTQNVTIALNIVARSLELGADHEVLSTNHEYGALDRTWSFLSKERGFKYINREIPVPLTSRENFLEEFWKGVTPRTRVIFLSHITSPTAILFPVEEVVRRARAAGILTVIDGAHTAGQIPLNFEALGADFYGGNLHKWLCAPKGAGFLYARPEVQHLLKPLIVSWGYESEEPSGSTFIDYNEWWGTRDIAAFLSVPAAIEFQKKHHWDKVRADCHALACETLRRIEALTSIASFYPDDSWFSQMFSVPLPDSTNIVSLKTRLYDEYRVEVPLMEWVGHKLMRVSIQGYNSMEDVDQLLNALTNLL